MISDADVYRSANVMIREHGDDARAVAKRRANAFWDSLIGIEDFRLAVLGAEFALFEPGMLHSLSVLHSYEVTGPA